MRVHEKTFTNFSLDGVGGQHMGEALSQGRFTVLAPTVVRRGNVYVNVQRLPPVWVERLDVIGLYPANANGFRLSHLALGPKFTHDLPDLKYCV